MSRRRCRDSGNTCLLASLDVCYISLWAAALFPVPLAVPVISRLHKIQLCDSVKLRKVREVPNTVDKNIPYSLHRNSKQVSAAVVSCMVHSGPFPATLWVHLRGFPLPLPFFSPFSYFYTANLLKPNCVLYIQKRTKFNFRFITTQVHIRKHLNNFLYTNCSLC